jgi:hypothetical protein
MGGLTAVWASSSSSLPGGPRPADIELQRLHGYSSIEGTQANLTHFQK